jgi:hypothetical protein
MHLQLREQLTKHSRLIVEMFQALDKKIPNNRIQRTQKSRAADANVKVRHEVA